MKRLTLLALVVPMMLLPAAAAAQECSWNLLGLWDDEDAVNCHGNINPYISFDVHVVLCHEIPDPISAVCFRIENLPGSGSGGILNELWSSDFVTGDVATGITLTFDPPIWEMPLLHLGVLEFFMIDPTWIPPDYQIEVAGARLWDLNQQFYDLIDSRFVFTPSEPVDECWTELGPSVWLKATSFSPETGSTVAGEFPFSFIVSSWNCEWPDQEPAAYTGRIEVEGVGVEQFSGEGTQGEAFTISTEGIPPGEPFAVEVYINMEQTESTYCRLEYFAEDLTPVAPEVMADGTFSTIKALY